MRSAAAVPAPFSVGQAGRLTPVPRPTAFVKLDYKECATMPYKLKIPEAQVFGKGKFVNAAGHTECVEFVQQATGAIRTPLWKQGAHVIDATPGSIPRGTAVATFDKNRKYPTDTLGKHAAVYIGHDATGITVLDQWKKQGEVQKRVISVHRPDFPRVDSAKQYYVVE
jgi:hypothetical protein